LAGNGAGVDAICVPVDKRDGWLERTSTSIYPSNGILNLGSVNQQPADTLIEPIIESPLSPDWFGSEQSFFFVQLYFLHGFYRMM